MRIAIDSLASQHDETSLDAIDAALQRFPDDAKSMASSLAIFQSEAANRIEMKYRPDDAPATSNASPNPDADPATETTNQ